MAQKAKLPQGTSKLAPVLSTARLATSLKSQRDRVKVRSYFSSRKVKLNFKFQVILYLKRAIPASNLYLMNYVEDIVVFNSQNVLHCFIFLNFYNENY